METKYWLFTKPVFLLCVSCIVSVVIAQPINSEQQAKQILEISNIKGGLIVHVGCGDGKLTAALHAGDSFLVHGLDIDERAVQTAREHIRKLGIYGPVSVDIFDGKRLPYVDNLVNLVVV
jgi:2-polyprenyl-3-methyl-5-hydroxy-6-metoxy-1,4-benzoquinol methylase